MGNYTKYKLTYKILSDDISEKNLIAKVIRNKFNFLKDDEVKWYSHKEDLLQLSNDYTNVLFTLKGIGEEHNFIGYTVNSDIWIAYFLNGLSYIDYLEYKFPKFNPNKLK